MIFFYNDENFFHFFHISAFKMKFSSQFSPSCINLTILFPSGR